MNTGASQVFIEGRPLVPFWFLFGQAKRNKGSPKQKTAAGLLRLRFCF